ncbi:GntR family transcriptional regulator [Polymorphobacter sp.]|uniref:GntR family transcriptional regulator n=1 Tax=Polymorphobacter sp. TaxID=1909290 RepID=UPI003F71391C
MRKKHVVVDDGRMSPPRYVQAYTALRDWIQQGVYLQGAQLPSEPELCKLFGVSRITVRAAVELLEKEKLVIRKQGRGTFVSAAIADVPSRGDFAELVRRLRQLDAKSSLKDIEIVTRQADENTARDLQISTEDMVIQASFTRMRGNKPIGVTLLSIPTHLGIALTEEDLRNSPAPTILQGKGYDILGAHQLIGATLADARIAEALGINIGAPIVHVRLLVLDLFSKPIELLTAYYLAESYVHHVFLAARPGAAANATVPAGSPA